jgi:hypothetical protein
MKSFAIFLLLENPLYVSSISKPAIRALAERLFRPVVKIIEEDCATEIGLRKGIRGIMSSSWIPPEDTSVTRYAYEHLVDLSGNPFDNAELLALISEGNDLVRVRHPAHCASVGGICKKCWYAHAIQSTADFLDPSDDSVAYTYYDTPPSLSEVTLPPIGTTVRIEASLGQVKPLIPASQKALFAYACESFIGSLIGAKSYDDFPLPVKPSLLRMSINKNVLDKALAEAAPSLSTAHLRFISDIEDVLDKALAIVILYLLSGEDATAEIPSSPSKATPIYLSV